MTINFDIEKIKAFVKDKRFLKIAAAVCALAIILTVVFFARFVFDCVSTANAVTVESKNSVKYEVYYPESEFYPNDAARKPQPQPAGQTYISGLTNKILIYNECSTILSKPVRDLACSYTMTETFIVRTQNNGNAVILSLETNETAKLNKIVTDSLDGDWTDVLLLNPYEITLAPYKEKFNRFAEELAKETKGLKLSGELAVEFTFVIKSGQNNVNSVVKRGLVIPFTSDTYKISYTGQELLTQQFPERNVRFPSLVVTILITLLVAALTAGLTVSLKTLTAEPDPYKRRIKEILKKFGDEIVVASGDALLPVSAETIVQSFKELVKLSQIMQKPVICLPNETSTVFYILCDGMMYKYCIENHNSEGIPKKDI